MLISFNGTCKDFKGTVMSPTYHSYLSTCNFEFSGRSLFCWVPTLPTFIPYLIEFLLSYLLLLSSFSHRTPYVISPQLVRAVCRLCCPLWVSQRNVPQSGHQSILRKFSSDKVDPSFQYFSVIRVEYEFKHLILLNLSNFGRIFPSETKTIFPLQDSVGFAMASHSPIR